MGQQVFALAMAVDIDARNLGAIMGPKVGLSTVKPMEEGGGASIWDALKVPRGKQITA